MNTAASPPPVTKMNAMEALQRAVDVLFVNDAAHKHTLHLLYENDHALFTRIRDVLILIHTGTDMRKCEHTNKHQQ